MDSGANKIIKSSSTKSSTKVFQSESVAAVPSEPLDRAVHDVTSAGKLSPAADELLALCVTIT